MFQGEFASVKLAILKIQWRGIAGKRHIYVPRILRQNGKIRKI